MGQGTLTQSKTGVVSVTQGSGYFVTWRLHVAELYKKPNSSDKKYFQDGKSRSQKGELLITLYMFELI